MSEDPKLFDAGDYNLFRYCHNDPIDFTDAMGLEQNWAGLAPREISRMLADDNSDNSYNFIMGLMQRQFSSAISAGIAGYQWSAAWSALQGQNLTMAHVEKRTGDARLQRRRRESRPVP